MVLSICNPALNIPVGAQRYRYSPPCWARVSIFTQLVVSARNGVETSIMRATGVRRASPNTPEFFRRCGRYQSPHTLGLRPAKATKSTGELTLLGASVKLRDGPNEATRPLICSAPLRDIRDIFPPSPEQADRLQGRLMWGRSVIFEVFAPLGAMSSRRRPRFSVRRQALGADFRATTVGC